MTLPDTIKKIQQIVTLCALLASPAVATTIPLDEHGLPMWVPAVFEDFPVQIVLDDRAALDDLLAEVPIASFVPEQLRFLRDGRVQFRPRVTESELESLERAGYQALRVPDVNRRVQEEIEKRWLEQAARGGEILRRGERGVYHTYAQLGQILQDAAADHPEICALDVAGQSVQGRNLYRVRITDNVQTEEAEPEVRISANMHGGEKISMEMSVYLIEYLTDQYGQPGYEDVTFLVDNYDIWLMPLHNPDGHVANMRYNANGVDLNRNFPVPDGSIGDDGTWNEEPETVAMIEWGESSNHVIGINGHSGILCMIYPWTYTSVPPPNEEAIVLLCEEYAYYNEPMWNEGYGHHGIVPGRDYGIIKGPQQDWSLHVTGCIDVAVEFSWDYQPPPSQLEQYWEENRESFMHWIKASRYGVNGIVTSAGQGQPLAATIEVAGIDLPTKTDPDHGDYYMLLHSGSFDITFSAPGHEAVVVQDVATAWGEPTVLNVALPQEGSGIAEATGPMPERLLVADQNPFSPRSKLRFELVQAGHARLAVFDSRGRLVRRLVDEPLRAGAHSVAWDGRDRVGRQAATGLYLIHLEAAGSRDRMKILLLR